MLEIDYSLRFGELIQSTDCEIELPQEWIGFFEERGEIAAYSTDERANSRLIVRSHGLLWIERSFSFLNRTREPAVVYTKDFSRHGVGFLSSVQLFPNETVRILLATFWIRLQVVRARRITSKCFEIGTILVAHYEMSPDAFMIDAFEIGVPPNDPSQIESNPEISAGSIA